MNAVPSVPLAPPVVDWRPDRTAAVVWNLLALPLLLLALAVYLPLAALGRGGSISGRFGPVEVLLFLLLSLVLLAALLGVHEALHGLAMAAFGARPRFGAAMVARVAPALYTTAPGHRFTRGQYLVVALAPAVLVSAAGAAACLTPVGVFLALPLAGHLAGCIGDFAATIRLLREPPGTACEDLRDGIRFHRPATAREPHGS